MGTLICTNLRLAVAALLIIALAKSAVACFVCVVPYQSLLDKVTTSEQVVVARRVEGEPANWQVVQVIKGDEVVADQAISVSQSEPIAPGDLQLLRREAADDSWVVECALDADLRGFLAAAVQLSANRPASASLREQSHALRFFLPYLEHANRPIADSAYNKLATAPYAVLRTLGPHLDPDRLLAWIENPQIAQKRGSLYVTLLGVCGGERESALLEEWIAEGWSRQSPDSLAALLTAHAELNGEEGVRLIEKSYIQNRERTLGELIAAINALRVHGQADGDVARSRIQASFQLLLRERPQLAELIIEDCARWKDWSFAPKLMEIHAGGEQPWNNAMILKYLEACPLPEAKQFLSRRIATEQALNASK